MGTEDLQGARASIERYEGLSDRQVAVVSAEVASRKKTRLAAYLLWFFLGGIGIHNFYLGRTTTGIVQLVMFIVGWCTFPIVIGIPILLVLYTWVLVDAFRIPAFIDQKNAMLEETLTAILRR
jgi:TM2 domain-containing membrane protein YozV